jgi:hypothetical protein
MGGLGSADAGAATRTMLKVSIACLCVAALIAIGALIGDDFGDTEAKVALMTLAVAIYDLTAMGGVAAQARPELRTLGSIGVLASGVAFVLALALIWADWEGDNEGLAQAWGSRAWRPSRSRRRVR